MYKLNKFTLLIFILVFSNYLNAQSILINEVMSSNTSTIADEDGDYPDWIELFNPTDNEINLYKYSLTDDADNPAKWLFPNITLSPGEYLVVFASGKDRKGNILHTNFKIKSSGEYLWLRDSTGQILDKVDSVEIPADVSIGRSIDNLSEWLYFSEPTPGASNNTGGFNAFAEPPKFSIDGGFFSSNLSIEIHIDSANATVFYTTDGSEPSDTSLKYTHPISIDSTTVIRSKSFQEGYLPSRTVTNTYFMNENVSLPVVSLATDPKNLWDDETGIYVNYENDWERPVHIEIFEKDGSRSLSMDAGMELHGSSSRELPQKSFKIKARSSYGNKIISYKIFPALPYSEYKSFLLRNAGNDNNIAHFRDPLMQSIVGSLDFEKQAYRPSVVFINGEYWGIYNFRENIDKHYLERRKNADPDNIDLLRVMNSVLEGDRQHYNELYYFIKYNDVSIDSNYNYVNSLMEVDNYIAYTLSEMYFVNIDWYPNNTKFWRPKTDSGKWRWIMYDTDRGFGLYNPGIYYKDMLKFVTDTSRYPSVIFNGLIQNEKFRYKFINTFADYANSIFQPAVVISKIDSIKGLISSEAERHFERWNGNYENWDNNVEELREFAGNRLDYMKQHFIHFFDLDSTVSVHINTGDIGIDHININSLKISNFPWSGEYFPSVPIRLSVYPQYGYRIKGWLVNGSLISNSNTLEVNLNNSATITALVESNSEKEKTVVLNEINYHPSNDINSGEWVELKNVSDSTIDLSNWRFFDSNDDNFFTIPINTTIGSKKYLVLCADTNLFKSVFPKIKNYIGNFNFKLSNEGEKLRLYNPDYDLIDFADYRSVLPWPSEPNGEGTTLELGYPSTKNDYSNWYSSIIKGGTPGTPNIQLLKNSLFINEFLAINDSINTDGNNEYDDWVELFYKSDSSLYFDEFYLSDNFKDPLKAKLPVQVFQPDEHLLFWADKQTEQGSNHLDFKLKGKGEEIALSYFNGISSTFIDTISFGQQTGNVSYGRYPDGYKRWKYFNNPTPGDFNSTLENYPPYMENKLPSQIKIKPDSTYKINVWYAFEDVETPDSLMDYNITLISDSVIYSFNSENGMLEISTIYKFANVYNLIITAEDTGGLDYTDTVKIKAAQPVGTNLATSEIPREFFLSQNYPNPFNPSTNFKFGLPHSANVKLVIYNLLGEQVKVIVNSKLSAGIYNFKSDFSNYPSGIYFYRFKTNGFIQTKKFILLK